MLTGPRRLAQCTIHRIGKGRRVVFNRTVKPWLENGGWGQRKSV